MLNLKIETLSDTEYYQRTFLIKLSGKPSILKSPFFQHPAKYWGYVFIGYFFFKTILPILIVLITFISILASKVNLHDPQPASEGQLVRILLNNGYIASWHLYLYSAVSLIIVAVPILVLIGGIFMLKLKGRKLIMFAFGIDFACRIALAFVALTNTYMNHIIWASMWTFGSSCMFMMLDIVIILYFAKPSVESQFLEPKDTMAKS